MAKGFLSDDRENLFLWSSYASLISSQKGRVAEARHVYIACLSLERKPDDPYVVELFANWAEMEWLRGEEPASLAVAVAAFSAGSIDLSESGKQNYSTARVHTDRFFFSLAKLPSSKKVGHLHRQHQRSFEHVV